MINQRMVKVLALATAIAAPAEGLRQYAYHDPGGVLTVCYGHTETARKGVEYTLEQCKNLLDKDMLDAIQTVERCAPGLPDKVLVAFADAVYNLGQVIACNKSKSTAARYLAAGDLRAACNELPKWDKGTVGGMKVSMPGLTKRRELERSVCLEGAPPVQDEVMVASADVDAVKEPWMYWRGESDGRLPVPEPDGGVKRTPIILNREWV